MPPANVYQTQPHDPFSQTIKAFERAREIWNQKNREGERQVSADEVTVDEVRLYSFESPLGQDNSRWKKHLSPFRILDRFHHATKKDLVYFDQTGEVYHPGIEIRLRSLEEAERLTKLLGPLSPEQFPSLSTGVRLVLRMLAWCLSLLRKIHGERVLSFYCANDRSFYGSVYAKNREQFVSVLGPTRESVERGVRYMESLLST